MSNIGIQLAIIIVMMLANGFFSASEIAVVSSRRGRLQQRAETGSRGARTALELAEEPNRFLATVQVGMTLIGVFAAAFGGDVLAGPLARTIAPYVGARYAQPIALTLVVLFITYLTLILGELVPKRLALQNAEAFAIRVAPTMRWISRLAAPIVWFLTLSTQGVLRLIGRSQVPEEPVTEEDVLSLVREGTAEGSLEVGERELIERVFNFTDVTARAIMTPRTEIFAVPIDMPLDEIVTRVTESGYSRIPVYRGSLDAIQGILFAKDILRLSHRGDDNVTPPQLTEILRPPVFVLEHQRIASVLQQFKQARTHLALVLDEYGQTDGLLTLEDVLEELTGDIADEYDEADTMAVRRHDGSWLLDGLLAYTDAEKRIGLPSRSELAHLPSFDTVAGLVLALLGHIPATGETTQIGAWQIEVVDMDGVRIDKLLILPQTQPDSAEQTAGALAVGAVVPLPEGPQTGRGDQKNGPE